VVVPGISFTGMEILAFSLWFIFLEIFILGNMAFDRQKEQGAKNTGN
jgi:hypothetical protein